MIDPWLAHTPATNVTDCADDCVAENGEYPIVSFVSFLFPVPRIFRNNEPLD